jgi:hypothetical protein
MKRGARYFIRREGDVEAGPYELAQMASLLRKRIITPDTPSRHEDEEHWQPFSWQPDFIVVREMSPDAIDARISELDEENPAGRPLIPLPSAEFWVWLGIAALGCVFTGVAVFLLSWASATLGGVFAIIGITLALVATCMIYVRIVDEDYVTLLLLGFIPGYDIYYLVANFSEYFPYICARYAGIAMAIAAVVGIAAGHPNQSPLEAVLKSL